MHIRGRFDGTPQQIGISDARVARASLLYAMARNEYNYEGEGLKVEGQGLGVC